MADSPDGLTRAFLRAVATGRLDDVRASLEATPALVNATGPHPFWGGRPQPLHVAIECDQRELIDLLLQCGADVNGDNAGYDHWSPLMIAINRDHVAIREQLLAAGARVGVVEALMMADDARVEELVRDGVGGRDGGLGRQSAERDGGPNGGSLLSFARTPWAIDRLIGLGMPADVPDRWGTTPVDAMSRLGSRGHALVRHLVSRGATAAPVEYARLGDVETLRRLVDADPSIARLDEVLVAAVDFRHHALVEWLLERGANVNARTGKGARQTPLHSAAWNGDLTMVALLVKAGADRTARDAQYDATPLGWAETSIEVTRNARCAEVVAYLDEGNTGEGSPVL